MTDDLKTLDEARQDSLDNQHAIIRIQEKMLMIYQQELETHICQDLKCKVCDGTGRNDK